MQRLYVAKHNGVPKFLIVENEVYTIEALDGSSIPDLPKEPAGGDPVRRGGRRRKPGQAKGTKRHTGSSPGGRAAGQRRCGKCGETGHRRDNCPLDRPSDSLENYSDENPASADEKPEDADIEAKIHELRDQGFDSLRIAAKLHVPLSKVKEILAI